MKQANRRLVVAVIVAAVALAWIGPPRTRIVKAVDYLAEADPGPAPAAADNAAIPLLRALGTHVLLGDRAQVLAQLGAPADLPGTVELPEEPDEVMDARFDDADPTPEQREAWARWSTANEPALDALMEASMRPRLWLSVVRDPDRGLVTAIPPEMLSDLIDRLHARAQLAVLERRHDAAWEDIEALLRLRSLVDQLEGLLARLIAGSCATHALERTRDLVARGGVEERMLTAMREALGSRPEPRTLEDDLTFDGLFALDHFTREAGSYVSGDPDSMDVASACEFVTASLGAMAPLLRDPTPEARAEVRRLVDARTKELKRRKSWALERYRFRGSRSIGRHVGEVMSTMVLAILPNVLDRLHALERRRHIVMLGIALRLHALRHGGFPETIDSLVFGLPPPLPEVVGYERTEMGCTLWDPEDEAFAIELSR